MCLCIVFVFAHSRKSLHFFVKYILLKERKKKEQFVWKKRKIESLTSIHFNWKMSLVTWTQQSIDTGLNLGQLHVNPRCSMVRKTQSHRICIFFLQFSFCVFVFCFSFVCVCMFFANAFELSFICKWCLRSLQFHFHFILLRCCCYCYFSFQWGAVFLAFSCCDVLLINHVYCLQDIEHGASPDGPSAVSTVPKKCEKAILARIWGNFDKKYTKMNIFLQNRFFSSLFFPFFRFSSFLGHFNIFNHIVSLNVRFIFSYMKPLLTHSRPTLLETLPVCCNPVARLLTTTEQLTQVNHVLLWCFVFYSVESLISVLLFISPSH